MVSGSVHQTCIGNLYTSLLRLKVRNRILIWESLPTYFFLAKTQLIRFHALPPQMKVLCPSSPNPAGEHTYLLLLRSVCKMYSVCMLCVAVHQPQEQQPTAVHVHSSIMCSTRPKTFPHLCPLDFGWGPHNLLLLLRSGRCDGRLERTHFPAGTPLHAHGRRRCMPPARAATAAMG